MYQPSPNHVKGGRSRSLSNIFCLFVGVIWHALKTMFLAPENWVWLRVFPVRVRKHGGGAPCLKKNRANGSHQLHELIGTGFQSRPKKVKTCLVGGNPLQAASAVIDQSALTPLKALTNMCCFCKPACKKKIGGKRKPLGWQSGYLYQKS